jgi:hypothetical protein
VPVARPGRGGARKSSETGWRQLEAIPSRSVNAAKIMSSLAGGVLLSEILRNRATGSDAERRSSSFPSSRLNSEFLFKFVISQGGLLGRWHVEGGLLQKASLITYSPSRSQTCGLASGPGAMLAPGGPNAKGGADGKPDRCWRSFLSGDRHGDRTVTVRRLDAAATEACVASMIG